MPPFPAKFSRARAPRFTVITASLMATLGAGAIAISSLTSCSASDSTLLAGAGGGAAVVVPAGEVCTTPVASALAARFEPAQIVLPRCARPGDSTCVTRSVKVRVNPDICQARTVVFTSSDATVVAAPANSAFTLHTTTLPLTIQGGATAGTSTITVVVPTHDDPAAGPAALNPTSCVAAGTCIEATLAVEVVDPTPLACSGTAAKTALAAGQTLRGNGGPRRREPFGARGRQRPQRQRLRLAHRSLRRDARLRGGRDARGLRRARPGDHLRARQPGASSARSRSRSRMNPALLPDDGAAPARCASPTRGRRSRSRAPSPSPTRASSRSAGSGRSRSRRRASAPTRRWSPTTRGRTRCKRRLTHRAVDGHLHGRRRHGDVRHAAPRSLRRDGAARRARSTGRGCSTTSRTTTSAASAPSRKGTTLAGHPAHRDAVHDGRRLQARRDLPRRHRDARRRPASARSCRRRPSRTRTRRPSTTGGTSTRAPATAALRPRRRTPRSSAISRSCTATRTATTSPPAAENLPAGVPPNDPSVIGDHPGGQCAMWVDPIDCADPDRRRPDAAENDEAAGAREQLPDRALRAHAHAHELLQRRVQPRRQLPGHHGVRRLAAEPGADALREHLGRRRRTTTRSRSASPSTTTATASATSSSPSSAPATSRGTTTGPTASPSAHRARLRAGRQRRPQRRRLQRPVQPDRHRGRPPLRDGRELRRLRPRRRARHEAAARRRLAEAGRRLRRRRGRREVHRLARPPALLGSRRALHRRGNGRARQGPGRRARRRRPRAHRRVDRRRHARPLQLRRSTPSTSSARSPRAGATSRT